MLHSPITAQWESVMPPTALTADQILKERWSVAVAGEMRLARGKSGPSGAASSAEFGTRPKHLLVAGVSTGGISS